MRYCPALLASLVLLPLCGCFALYSHEDVAFHLMDGDTGAAIEGGSVAVEYQKHPLALNTPQSRSARSRADGDGTISIANFWVHAGPSLQFTASGYDELAVLAEPRQRVPAEVEPVARRNPKVPRYAVILYRLPRPSVTIVVPADYVGPVTVEFKDAGGSGRLSNGQRSFTFEASPGGHVSMEAAPQLLRRLSPLHIDAREADGAGLPKKGMPPDARAFRWVASHHERGRHVYVVGSAADKDATEGRLYEVSRYKGGKLVRLDQNHFDATFDQMVAESRRRPTSVPSG